VGLDPSDQILRPAEAYQVLVELAGDEVPRLESRCLYLVPSKRLRKVLRRANSFI
jgi:hypothetical protein